jgi:histidyl-tRNA synthetase
MTPAAKGTSLELAERLRSSGLIVDIAYGDRSLKGGMKAADKSGAKFSLVLGDDELSSGSAALKNMKTGDQLSVTIASLHDVVRQEITNASHS